MNTTEFFNAIKRGDIEAVKQALEAGMSPEVKNTANESALDVACFNEQDAIAELLINPLVRSAPSLKTDMVVDHDNPVCVVGYSSIFPGSGETPEGFWQTLSGIHHQMKEVPAERWSLDEHYSPDKKASSKMYTRRGGFIDQSPYAFDANFFKIVPKEAEFMDPQQRLTLEAVWFALEHAGINPQTLKETLAAVYCGVMTRDYTDMLIQGKVEHNNFIGTGNGISVLSGRVSYVLGMQGPSMTIDTACSSSLVTTHLAMRSLQNGECDVALAGGVNAMLAPGVTINCCKANMLAEDGACKTFSELADGYGRGEGVGMLVLKRYKDAVRDGNTIYGIIRGSSVNQDGPSSGLTVPNKQAQIKVIKAALTMAGLSPDDIDFVEAHGTGTLLGDPIEINALKEVFDKRNPNIAPLLVNSAKSFIGHTEAAAGVAGIIRVLESFKHQALTAMPIQGKLNSKIQLEDSRLAILQERRDWKSTEGHVRRAGISSFGYSGTNAHIILEEPPRLGISLQQKLELQWESERQLSMPTRASIDNNSQVLVLSAKDKVALANMVQKYIDAIEAMENKDQEAWLNFAYSTQTGRAQFSYRLAIQADSLADCLRQLKQWKPVDEKKNNESIQMMIPKLESIDLSSIQQRYQDDVLFAAICNAILTELSTGQLSCIKPCLEGLNDSDQGQQNGARLVGMYALFKLYQRLGIKHEKILSSDTGHFLAAVLDGRLSFSDMLSIYQAYLGQDKAALAEVSASIVSYDSDGLWPIQSANLCQDLFDGNISNCKDGSSWAIELKSASQSSLLTALSTLYSAGYNLNWQNLWQGSIRKFISLPLYPFQRQEYRFKAKKLFVQTVNDESFTKAYQTNWSPCVLSEQENASSQKPIVMIVTDNQWKTPDFIKSLSGTNRAILWVYPGERGKTKIAFSIAYNKAEDWQWLAEQWASSEVQRVIDLRYLDVKEEGDLVNQKGQLNYFTQRLIENQLLFKVWPGNVIKQGYIACFPDDKTVDESIKLGHAGLQGQLRSIALLHNSIVSAFIDASPFRLTTVVNDLASKFLPGVALRYHNEQWHNQKLIPTLIENNAPTVQSYDSNEGIVLTGGLGALGLTMAKWYAEQGVGHIALISRRQPDAQQQVILNALTQQYKISIHLYQVDVANSSELSDAIQAISLKFTIDSVFHLAGKATIKRFEKLSEDDYQESLTAKVLGAINLKQALVKLSYWPKQVVLFSSAVSLLPEPGQAAYAASNRMLDAISHSGDKPIKVINWGLWGAAGAGANPEFVKRIRKGSGVLSEALTKRWLHRILASAETQVAVLSIDWQNYQKHLTKAEKDFTKDLLPKHQNNTESSDNNDNQREYLLSLPETELAKHLLRIIKQCVIEVSGKPEEDLQAETTFEEELGLDSNLLGEITGLIQEKIGREDEPYAATLLNDYGSISALKDYLMIDLINQKTANNQSDTPTDYIRQLVGLAEAKVKIKKMKKGTDATQSPLILIHTIMGSVFFYKALVEHMKYTGSVYGIDNPYFSNLAQKFNSVEEMASAYAREIQQQFGDKPVRLAGLSFAGAVAYEVAQLLIDFGVKVDSVLMFDSAMPGAGDLTLPPGQRQYVMGEIAHDINEYYQAEINNNQRILNAYRPQQPKKELRVILLKARSRDSVNRTLPALNDVCNGWLDLFCPEVYSVPGSHFSMFDRTYVDTTVHAMQYAYTQTQYFIDGELKNDKLRNREKLLLQAAKNGDSYLVTRLLKLGVNPMVVDESGVNAACYAAQNDDLCSLAWLHYYAQNKLSINALFPWAQKGNALKTISYLVENLEVTAPDEPDAVMLLDVNKQQFSILHGQSRPYQQREWIEILTAHNDSGKGNQEASAMQILPPKTIQPDISPASEVFDLMKVTKITCGSKFKYDVVNLLKKGHPEKPNLFMFHAASGLALPYTSLDDLNFGNVYGISNPYFGLDDKKSFASIDDMAEHYIARMKTIQPHGPYYLAGWSLGGIVSQAMASILEQRGETVGVVIMIDSVNHSGKPYYLQAEQRAIEKILQGNETLDRYEGVKEAIKRCYLNTSEMLHHYQAKPFSGRVILLKADEHETTLANDEDELIKWRRALLQDPFSGWGDLLPNVEVQSVVGGHNELFDRSYVSGVHMLMKDILLSILADKEQNVSLVQRWGMNFVKALRRADERMIQLLIQHPSADYSYQDIKGNLLDVIIDSEQGALLDSLDAKAIMQLTSKTGGKASDIALELGLLDLFNKLEEAAIKPSLVSGGNNSFFYPSSSTQNSNGKVLGL